MSYSKVNFTFTFTFYEFSVTHTLHQVWEKIDEFYEGQIIFVACHKIIVKPTTFWYGTYLTKCKENTSDVHVSVICIEYNKFATAYFCL